MLSLMCPRDLVSRPDIDETVLHTLNMIKDKIHDIFASCHLLLPSLVSCFSELLFERPDVLF